MISPATSRLVSPRAPHFRVRVCSVLVLTFGALFALSPESLAQDDANRRRKGGEEGGGGRGNMSPQEMQERITSRLREMLDVPDDEEWKIISARLMAVTQLRRSSGAPSMFGGGMFPGRGGGSPGGGGGGGSGGGGGDSSRGGRSGRGGMTGGNSETAALSSAVRDKLPEAEIKARLDRVRQVRKENEVKLTKAQEELRAVLSIRQEAVAVMWGLLP